jgi:O-antigen ligase
VDPLLLALIAAMLVAVWRIQSLYPVLARLQVPSLAAVSAYVLFLIDRDRRRSLGGLKHPLVKIAVLTLVLMVLSVPGSVYPGGSFRFIMNDYLKTFVLMMLLAAGMRAFIDVERCVLALVAGAALYATATLMRFEVGPGGRLAVLYYYDANDLALFLVCTMPLCVYFIQQGRKGLYRIVGAVALLLCFVTLVKTGSRGGFLALLGCGAYMLLRYSAIPLGHRLVALGAGVVLMMFVAGETYWELMGTMLRPTADYNWSGESDVGRMDVWGRAIGYMLDRPFLGVGVAGFARAEGTLSEFAFRHEYGEGFKWSVAYNSFLESGAELGVPGLIVFTAFVVCGFRALGRIAKVRGGHGGVTGRHVAMAQAMSATLVAFCVGGFFLSQEYAAYLYSIMGLTVALERVSMGAPSVEGVGRQGGANRGQRRRPTGRGGGFLAHPGRL